MTVHTLVLIRHAEATSSSSGDRHRPLSVDGQAQAERLGVRLARQVPRVDEVFASPAVRTQETANRVLAQVAHTANRNVVDGLYWSGADQIIQTARSSDESATAVMIVGHEPSISSAATMLAADQKQRDQLLLGVPTGTAIVARFEGEWADIPFSGCELTILHEEPRPNA